MNSESIKIKYIECQKGGFHQGEQLNTVCLNPECKFNPVCCCACVDQFHNGHKTTTLKKLLMDSKQAASDAQGQSKQSVKGYSLINTDIIHNLIDSAKKDTFETFKNTSESIKATLNQIQNGLKMYYDSLQQTISNQGQQNHPGKIFQSIQNIQGASNISTMLPALQQLLASLQSVGQKNELGNKKKPIAQDSLINLIEHSNRQVIDAATTRLVEIRNQLVKGSEIIFESTMGIKNIFNRDVFTFSQELKSADIWITDSYKAVSKRGQVYQAILMEPGMNTSGQITAFKYRINKSSANWVAIGMGHQNVLEKNKFIFDYKNIGHGCYMISSNAGTWSHVNEDLNNKVKAFSFKEGDTITCIINRKMREIFFVKDIPPGVLHVSVSQRQIYELPYVQNPSDPLHPCIVFYYENDEVEYVPAINLSSIPRYEYLYSQSWKHPRVKIIDSRMVKALEGNNEYRSVLLNKCLEQNFDTVKKFSFRIVRSTSNWVAIGMCHSKTAANCNYGFNYQTAFHGYYMISSNGGSWSTIDLKKNNVVKAFKFSQGDVVQCQVIFGNGPNDSNNRIIFRKGMQTYELNFKGVLGDRLYPCAMVHYAQDQIGILPSF